MQLPNVNGRWTYHIDETIEGHLKQLSSVRKGQAVTAHLPWTQGLDDVLTANSFKRLLIIRDPRDIAVSGCHYVTNMDKSHLLHEYFRSLVSDEARLLRYIVGVPDEHYPGGRRPQEWRERHAESFLPWLDDNECLVVRFEDLVGEHGCGSADAQIQTVKKIAHHLGVPLDDADVQEISKNIYSSRSRTFRRGQIGGWSQAFNASHKAAFKAKYGDLLIRLGYEVGNDW